MYGNAGGFGIFEGSGAEEHFSVKALPHTHEGATFEVTCSHCGTTNHVTLEWQQILAAAQSPQTQKLPVDPVTGRQWHYDAENRRMWPEIGCVRCKNILGPSITPDEASRILNEGRMGGFVVLRTG